MNPYGLEWLNTLLKEIRPSVVLFTRKDFVSITIFVHSINRESGSETLMSYSQEIKVYSSQPRYEIHERETGEEAQKFDIKVESLRQDSPIQISEDIAEYHVTIYVPHISDKKIKRIILEAIGSNL